MKRKILFLFVIFTVAQIALVSCCGSPFGSTNTIVFELAITQIDVTALYDFEDQESIAEGDSISSDFLLIKIDFQSESASIFDINNFGIIQGAYACSEPMLAILKSKIKSFTIKSDQPFQNHPAGYDLGEYAIISPSWSQEIEFAQTIQSFVDANNESYSEASTRIISLNSIPENDLYHQFNIEIESEDGQVISSQTQHIKWK